MEIPQKLVDAIIFLRGPEEGLKWIALLPAQIALHSTNWKLDPLAVAQGGAMSCCVFCQDSNGSPVVLKIPVDAGAGRREARALELWARGGATPTVLCRSRETGAFVMERIDPGNTAILTSGAGDAIKLLNVIDRMHSNPTANPTQFDTLRTIAEMRLGWAEERFCDSRYAQDTTPLTSARNLMRDLCNSTSRNVTLHGDLQQKNILEGRHGEWYAIDPLPCNGDINADPALWAVMQEGSPSILDRLEQLAVHPLLDVDRLQAWAYVFASAELRPYLPSAAKRMRTYINWFSTHVAFSH